MKIQTDSKWKFFLYGNEVPRRVYTGFDYLDEDERSGGWLRYRKKWYHISEFMRCQGDQFGAWHGYLGDSFFSGALIKVSSDGERYMIGTYYS